MASLMLLASAAAGSAAGGAAEYDLRRVTPQGTYWTVARVERIASPIGGQVLSVVPLADGSAWVRVFTDRTRIGRLSPTGDITWQTFDSPALDAPTASDDYPTSLAVTPDGRIWFFSRRGLERLTPGGTPELVASRNAGLSPVSVRIPSAANFLEAAPDNSVWFVGYGRPGAFPDAGYSQAGYPPASSDDTYRVGPEGNVTRIPRGFRTYVNKVTLTVAPDSTALVGGEMSPTLTRVHASGEVDSISLPGSAPVASIGVRSSGALTVIRTGEMTDSVWSQTTDATFTRAPADAYSNQNEQPTADADFATATDGTLWFSDFRGIGYINDAGEVAAAAILGGGCGFALPNTGHEFRAGADGTLWNIGCGQDADIIYRITPDTGPRAWVSRVAIEKARLTRKGTWTTARLAVATSGWGRITATVRVGRRVVCKATSQRAGERTATETCRLRSSLAPRGRRLAVSVTFQPPRGSASRVTARLRG